MSDNSQISTLLQKAWSQRGQGLYKKAKVSVEEARVLCRESDLEHLGRVYHILAQFESDHDQYEDALELLKTSQSFYQRSGNSNKIAHSTRHIADIQSLQGDLKAAKTNYTVALELYRSAPITHSLDMANALRGYACCLESLTEYKQAISAWKETRVHYKLAGVKAGVKEAGDRISSLSKL
ncbi:MAG: tetratricopeptide repeat protein [Bacteroidia bacterium]|nr:tetratricopeptide repeat protein [Bacteroidia bacterium]